MGRIKILIVGLVITATATACSTMDDVKVSHPCDGPVTVILYHLQAGGTFSDGSPGYLGKSWKEVAPPDKVTVIAGLVNLGADDRIEVVIDVSGWEVEFTRAEFHDRDGLITLPPEACP